MLSETERPLQSWLLDELQSPPQSGRHPWFFWKAVKLLRYREQETVYQLLRTAAQHVGRYVPDREIREAVKDAIRWRATHGPTATPLQKILQDEMRWPKPDLPKIDQLVRSGPRRRDLRDLTKERFFTDTRHTEAIIDRLYPGNPLLCCARSSWRFATRRREIWRGRLHTLPLLVPSPMSSVFGRTHEGTGPWSEHALSNTGPRKYLVIEFDFAEYTSDGKETLLAPWIRTWAKSGNTIQDACAALLLHLGERGPLTMIVFSGGKSLHGWFLCGGTNEHQLHRWMAGAVQIGADPVTWTRSQFVRMPDGTRENGKRQTIEYFNPGVLA